MSYGRDKIGVVIMCLAIAFGGVAVTLPLLKLGGVLLLSWTQTSIPLAVCILILAFIYVAQTRDE